MSARSVLRTSPRPNGSNGVPRRPRAAYKIFFTRSRPYKKNDQATIESKNNHLVRRYALYWRYDTPEALALLNQLWPLVTDRLNYFTPTKKPVGWVTDAAGGRKRIYDRPAPPLDRLLAADVLAPAQQAEKLLMTIVPAGRGGSSATSYQPFLQHISKHSRSAAG